MQDSRWLPSTEIRLRPRDTALREVTGGSLSRGMVCGNAEEWRRRGQMDQEVGTLPIGKHHLVFDATIEHAGFDLDNRYDQAPPSVTWTGPLAFDVEVVPTLAEAMPLVDSAPINEAVRASLGLCIQPWNAGRDTAVLVFDVDTKRFPVLATTAVVARAELLRDNEVKQTTRLVVHRYDGLLSSISVFEGLPQLFSYAELGALPVDKASRAEEWAHWKVRLTGTSEEVLHLWHADRQWSGSIEMPITDAFKQEADRMKGKAGRMFISMP
jgi:hypothetical protein